MFYEAAIFIFEVRYIQISEKDEYRYDDEGYYTIMSEPEARQKLQEKSNKFKRCIISLDGPWNAKCKMLDPGLTAPLEEDDEDDMLSLREVGLLHFLPVLL